MPRYRVEWTERVVYQLELDASDEEDAVQHANELAWARQEVETETTDISVKKVKKVKPRTKIDVAYDILMSRNEERRRHPPIERGEDIGDVPW